MIVKNNWIYSNIKDRMVDQTNDLKIYFNPQKFSELCFYDSSKNVAVELANKYDNIYLALSGGLDSEFVLVLFKENKIPIKPIIVEYNDNSLESSYAIHMCKKLNISPIIINCPDDLYINIFKKELCDKFNIYGFRNIPILLCLKFIEKNNYNNSVLLTGHDVIDDNFTTVASKASFVDWDFCYYYLSKIHCINFFHYTPEIVYSVIKSFDNITDTQEFKANLYNLDYRPKIKPILSQNMQDYCNKIISNKYHPNKYVVFDKEELLTIMNSWNM